MKKRSLWILSGLTFLTAFMELTGIPGRLILNIKIGEVNPFYWSLMLNFLIIGILSWAVLRFLCPEYCVGFRHEGLRRGLSEYGFMILLIAAVNFIGFYMGLFPYDAQPGFLKVLIEGVIYPIGVAIVEEMYIRGLLQNILENLLHKRPDRSFLAILFTSLLFGIGHIPGCLGLPFYVIVCKAVWTVCMGIFFGMLYKKSHTLWLPILAHYLVNLGALPYCFSNIHGYTPLTLIILVPAYVILGIYSLGQLIPDRSNK